MMLCQARRGGRGRTRWLQRQQRRQHGVRKMSQRVRGPQDVFPRVNAFSRMTAKATEITDIWSSFAGGGESNSPGGQLPDFPSAACCGCLCPGRS